MAPSFVSRGALLLLLSILAPSSDAQDPAYTPPPLPPPPPPPGCPNGYPAGLVVDASQTFQPMDGCGYSEAFQRAGWVYNALDDHNRGKVLDLLHDPKSGVGMSMYRIGIGSSPNSSRDWMNSIEPVSPGSPDAKPVYVWDRNDSSQVWWAQQAKKRGCTYFLGDAWSADGYMKTNGVDFNGTYLCGVRGTNCPTGSWMQHYANKLVQWVKFYQREGITITHLGCVNEPDQTTTYASMLMDGYQFYDFAQVWKPTVKAAFPHLKLIWNDGAGWEQARLRFKDLKNAAGPTWAQWFDQATAHAYDQVATLPQEVDQAVWQTEWAALASTFSYPWFDHLDEAEGIVWANRLANAAVVSNISMMTHWIGAATGNGASQLVQVFPNNTYAVSARLWAWAGFCRYTRPGSVRIYANATNPEANKYLTASAFMNPKGFDSGDGKIAVQIINNGNLPANLPIQVNGLARSARVKKITTYLLDNQHSLEPVRGLVSQAGPTKWVARVGPFSMITLVLDY